MWGMNLILCDRSDDYQYSRGLIDKHEGAWISSFFHSKKQVLSAVEFFLEEYTWY
jgi:hypothetical protein